MSSSDMKLPRILLVSLLLAVSLSAMAADQNREQGHRLQQALRQAQHEKLQLAQEKAEVEGQLKETQDKLDATQKKLKVTKLKSVEQLAKLSQDIDGVTAEKSALAAKLADTEKQLVDTSSKLRQTETDRRSLEVTGVRQRETIALCEGNNAKLYQYGTELLGAYEHKGCGAALLQAEPVTGLKRVEIENLMQDYRDKLDEQKRQPSPDGAAVNDRRMPGGG